MQNPEVKGNEGVYYNSYPLTSLAATLAAAAGVSPPAVAEPPLSWVRDNIAALAGGSVDRIFMYHSDAIPMYVYQQHTALFEPVFPHVQMAVPFLSTVESVTPVSHATMYTGASPKVHGIETYVRPVLTVDTLYDAFLREGKKCAIIAMPDSSFLHIFANKELDYFTVKDALEAEQVALRLFAEDRHDLISLHTFEYDNSAHAFGPLSQRALDSAAHEAVIFSRLAQALKAAWTNHRTLIGYAPDHGQHLTEDGGGAHGSLLPEDMNILHFYGVWPLCGR